MPGWYTLPLLATREIVGMFTVMSLCWIFIKRQEVSERSKEDGERFHHIATWIPFFYVLYGTMVAWDFEMTLQPTWHSAIYGLQNIISNFGMFLAFLVIWIYMLNASNKLVTKIKEYVYNYLAQMLLAFTLLWVYTFFAQYLTIWYGNLPEEVDRVMAMQNGDYSVLWWSMIFLKFVLPFTVLSFRVPRNSPPAILVVAVCIVVGTLFERYTWVAGINGTGTIPVLAAMAVGAAVTITGFMLVRRMMHHNHLLKA